MRQTPLVLAALAALSLASAALAQTPSATTKNETNQSNNAAQAAAGVGTNSTPGTLPKTDEDFLKETAQGSLYELALAKAAAEKAASPTIKQFAQTLIADHEKLNAGLMHLAQVKNVQLPTTMKPGDQVRLDKMRGLDGAQFDQAFKVEIARVNDEDKQTEAKELATTQDNDVKAFTGQMQAADTAHEQISKSL